MARKNSAAKAQSDTDGMDTSDSSDDSSANYIMGEIVVDDGSSGEASFLDEYTEEVDDEAESQAKTARRKLMNEGDDDDVLAGNPNDTDDFTKLEKYDTDEDWPLD